MSDALATYLHDHYAGATFGIDLLKRLAESHQSDPLGQFGRTLLPELEEDLTTLEEIIEHAGVGMSEVKQGGAWLGEKISRLKLSAGANEAFGTFESLEVLTLGILGKLKLWRTLAMAAAADSRLSGFDFSSLAARAEKQHQRTEDRRLELARTVFAMETQPAET